MVNVGPLEIILVLAIALIVLGPQRLPDVARSVGRGMREFRSALERPDDDDDPDKPGEPEEPNETLDRYQKEAESSEPSSSSRDLV